MTVPADAAAILDYLDARFEKFEMPCFGNMNIDYLTSRLHVYVSADSWFLLFDALVWWPGYTGLAGMIELVGPGVVGPQGFDNDRTTDPGCVETDDDNTRLEAVIVRGTRIDPAQLTLQVDGELTDDLGFWASVALLDRHRDALLATDAERDVFVPPGFACALVLDEWQHPDFDRLPSRTDTFRALARAIASGDFAAFPASAAPNTQWSNWLPK
ncbi:MAG TPA: hypothetical protein VLF18_06820 [Tahibacter sp.]|uniref:DUF7003 family protein n=1 Tax=Tahibacter sp. TaxID=2056211 RepID=UPI002B93A680|nr:hypothetical protein [Tahibacter sp.]HSX59893.1 hypothetical protein [Tahibacter sp.]